MTAGSVDPRVLYVDSDRRDTNTVRRVLEGTGWTVETEPTAGAALDRLDAVDHIVSEYRLSGMNGVEFLRAVRAERTDVHFTVCTDSGSEELASTAVAAGADEYVPKSGDWTTTLLERLRIAGAPQKQTVENSRDHHEPAAHLKERAMDEAPIGIVISDPNAPDNPLVYVNSTYERVTGYSRSEAIGRNCRYLQGEDSDPNAITAMRKAIDAEEPVSVELINYRKSGEPFWNRVDIAPLRNEAGETTHFVGFQADITDRKRAEMAAEKRAEVVAEQRRDLEHLLERIDGVVEDVMKALVEAETRTTIERRVCEQLTAPNAYSRAWIGTLDLEGKRLVSTAWSCDGDPPDTTIELDGGALEQAVETGETQTFGRADRFSDGLREVMAKTAVEAAVIPLAARGRTYGVVVVRADRPDAFGTHEVAIQTALGRMVANAIAASESKQILTADSVIEVTLAVSDPTLFFVALSAETGCRLEYSGSTYWNDERLRMLIDAEGASPERIEAVAMEDPRIRACTPIAENENGGVFELEITGDTIVSVLAENGALTKAIRVEDGDARLRLELPREADARTLVERLKSRYDDIEVAAYRYRDRPAKTKGKFIAAIADQLTDRQRTAARNAYSAGYFDPSRPVCGDELAASMGVSRSTFHQHLRAAERKVFAELFDAEPPA